MGVSTQFELNRRKALRHPLNGQQLGVARRQLGVRRQFNHLIAGKDLGMRNSKLEQRDCQDFYYPFQRSEATLVIRPGIAYSLIFLCLTATCG